MTLYRLIFLVTFLVLLGTPRVLFGEQAATSFDPIHLDPNEPSPYDGILVDEGTFTELIVLRSRVNSLSSELDIRLRLSNEQRGIYESSLESLYNQVETLTTELAGRELSWWDRYGGAVLGGLGFLIGATVTVLVTWAVLKEVDSYVLSPSI